MATAYARNPLLRDRDTVVASAVRAFVRDRGLLEEGDRSDASGTLNPDILQALKGMGLLGILVPARYGGMDATLTTYCAAIEELSRALFAAANIIAVHAVLVTVPLLLAAAEPLRARWLPRLASGAWLGAFGITEGHSGANIEDTRTHFTQDGDTLVINGSKRFITNGPLADVVMILAHEQSRGPGQGLSLILVESSRAGFSVGHIERKLALNAAPVSELSLDDVRVPRAHLVGEIGAGHHIVYRTLDHCRTVLAAGVLGLAKQGLDLVLDYVGSRMQSGRPLTANPSVAERIGTMRALIDAMEADVYVSAAVYDRSLSEGNPTFGRGTSTKVFCTEAVSQVFHIGSELLGGNSFLDGTFQRLYREATLVPRIYEGPNAVCNLLVAREVIQATRPQRPLRSVPRPEPPYCGVG